jgi:hypothetical protein
MQPIPATAQREALALLVEQVLSGTQLKLSPALQRRMAPDYQARGDALMAGASAVATEYSVSAALLQLQRLVLGQLMSDTLAARLLDNEDRSDPGADALRLPEVYGQVGQAVWRDLDNATDIAPARRELQREHVNRIANLLLRPGALTRADARSLLRDDARQLLPRLKAAARRNGLAAETRAHLRDSADTLTQALAAPLQRQGT